MADLISSSERGIDNLSFDGDEVDKEDTVGLSLMETALMLIGQFTTPEMFDTTIQFFLTVT